MLKIKPVAKKTFNHTADFYAMKVQWKTPVMAEKKIDWFNHDKFWRPTLLLSIT